MARNSSKVIFNTISEAFSASTPGEALAFLVGPTEFGPANDPGEIIANSATFKRRFGNTFKGNTFAQYALRMLDQGVKLRIARTPLANSATAESDPIVNVASGSPGTPLFIIKGKGPGVYYNDITFDITVDSDTSTSELCNFTFKVYLAGTLKETYSISMSIEETQSPYGYMDEVIENSKLVTVEYQDPGSSDLILQLDDYEDYPLTGGLDGQGTTLAAYQAGVESLAPYDDGIVILAPQLLEDESDNQLLAGILSSFASSVQNLFAVISVPYSLTDYSDAIEYIGGITLGSAPKFTVFTHGGLKTVVNGVVTTISEVADVAALIATQYNKAPWLSPSGLENGVINNASGVVVNYGTNSAEEERELITNAGINPVIRRFNAIVNWNAYTMADAANQDKFVSVVALEIYIKRVIMPTVERFLSKPNTPDTWLALYHSVKPFLESLVNKDAFYSYEWNGDQNATSVENLEVNEVTDIQNGNYKAILQAQLVSPIVLITIEFYKKSLSVSL